ncbi:MAG: methyltransferase [Acaryochloridaceae cyanobacterium CSU_5_19]|nr:methyltransferase [Acaryochloridaceae cyanobacterium CSU_5_19]
MLAQHRTLGWYKAEELRLVALPEMFHPTPGSSSLFCLETILKASRGITAGQRLSILDLGCGTGVVGLGLHAHAHRLHLSDISRRAVWCARLNGWLNGIFPICYRSDIFSAVPKGLFDLIVFNMPLMQAPIRDRLEQTMNDPGGQIFSRFIQGLSQFLAPEGEVFFAYSSLGDMALLDNIPQQYHLEQVAKEVFSELATERYVFRLTYHQ